MDSTRVCRDESLLPWLAQCRGRPVDPLLSVVKRLGGGIQASFQLFEPPSRSGTIPLGLNKLAQSRPRSARIEPLAKGFTRFWAKTLGHIGGREVAVFSILVVGHTTAHHLLPLAIGRM